MDHFLPRTFSEHLISLLIRCLGVISIPLVVLAFPVVIIYYFGKSVFVDKLNNFKNTMYTGFALGAIIIVAPFFMIKFGEF